MSHAHGIPRPKTVTAVMVREVLTEELVARQSLVWDSPPASVSARGLCEAILRYTERRYGERAAETLKTEYRIGSSEDVGRVVCEGLIPEGLVRPREGDSPGEFESVFRLR
jgi:uncharacterized repeat protein (TIGR04138 family)